MKAEAAWFAKAPSAPTIAIREYTLDEGTVKGGSNLPTQALAMTPAVGTDGVKVAIDITNLGNEPLCAMAFKKGATNESTGTVGDVQWLVSAKPGAKNTVTVAGKQYTGRTVGDMQAPAVGEKAVPVGKLTGVKAGTMHSEEGTLGGRRSVLGHQGRRDRPVEREAGCTGAAREGRRGHGDAARPADGPVEPCRQCRAPAPGRGDRRSPRGSCDVGPAGAAARTTGAGQPWLAQWGKEKAPQPDDCGASVLLGRDRPLPGSIRDQTDADPFPVHRARRQ